MRTFDTPDETLDQNGSEKTLRSSSITMAINLDFPDAKAAALRFRRYPSFSTAFLTAFARSGWTLSSPFKTRETVASDTPATSAISE